MCKEAPDIGRLKGYSEPQPLPNFPTIPLTSLNLDKYSIDLRLNLGNPIMTTHTDDPSEFVSWKSRSYKALGDLL